MSDFLPAYNFMMDSEDAGREYKQVPDVGGSAISGINSHDFPEEFAAIAAIPQSQRGDLVCAFYRNHLWNQWLEQLQSQDLANRVFDASVNMGSGTAVKLLQESIELADEGPGSAIMVDGKWGPITVALANGDDSERLIQDFRHARIQHYQAIVAANPSEAKFLPAWIARASK
jgi:lysozyme family protein